MPIGLMMPGRTSCRSFADSAGSRVTTLVGTVMWICATSLMQKLYSARRPAASKAATDAESPSYSGDDQPFDSQVAESSSWFSLASSSVVTMRELRSVAWVAMMP